MSFVFISKLICINLSYKENIMKIAFVPSASVHSTAFKANPQKMFIGSGRHPDDIGRIPWKEGVGIGGTEFDVNGEKIHFSIEQNDVVVVGVQDYYDKKLDKPTMKFVTGRIVDYAGNAEGLNTVKIIDKRGKPIEVTPINIFKGDLFAGAMEYMLGRNYYHKMLDDINKKRDAEVEKLDYTIAQMAKANIHAKQDLAKFNVAG